MDPVDTSRTRYTSIQRRLESISRPTYNSRGCSPVPCTRPSWLESHCLRYHRLTGFFHRGVPAEALITLSSIGVIALPGVPLLFPTLFFAPFFLLRRSAIFGATFRRDCFFSEFLARSNVPGTRYKYIPRRRFRSISPSIYVPQDRAM